jgi:glutaminase
MLKSTPFTLAQLQDILNGIANEAQTLYGQGKVASYIPALAQVAPRQFGMAVALVDGHCVSAGSAQTQFSIQSISKLFTFVLALKLVGDDVWQRVGREPSGAAFNSMVQLETEKGIPRNPFINAGALVITDMLTTRFAHLDIALLGALRRLSDSPDLNWDMQTAKSERDTAHRNMAMAYFMKSYGNFVNPPELVLDNYCRQCAIEMSCSQLAQATMFLANDGLDITAQGAPAGQGSAVDGEQFLNADAARRVNALLLTCGAYDAAGDFAYRIGLPVKTGVGGGIVAIVPGVGTVAVWGPELDAKGNSVLGAYALERLVQMTRWGHA